MNETRKALLAYALDETPLPRDVRSSLEKEDEAFAEAYALLPALHVLAGDATPHAARRLERLLEADAEHAALRFARHSRWTRTLRRHAPRVVCGVLAAAAAWFFFVRPKEHTIPWTSAEVRVDDNHALAQRPRLSRTIPSATLRVPRTATLTFEVPSEATREMVVSIQLGRETVHVTLPEVDGAPFATSAESVESLVVTRHADHVTIRFAARAWQTAPEGDWAMVVLGARAASEDELARLHAGAAVSTDLWVASRPVRVVVEPAND